MSGRERTEFAPGFWELRTDLSELLCICPWRTSIWSSTIFSKKDGKYRVIDCEWIFDFPVPVAFIIWRCHQWAVQQLSTAGTRLQDAGAFRRISDYAGCPRTFHKWGTYFAEHYVGRTAYCTTASEISGISLEEFRKTPPGEGSAEDCQLFVDTAEQVSGRREKIQAETVLQDGAFRVTLIWKISRTGRAAFWSAGRENHVSPDRPCRNQCEIKSGRHFRKSGAWRSCFGTAGPDTLVKWKNTRIR